MATRITHTAEHEGTTYSRVSSSRTYTHAVLARSWRKGDRVPAPTRREPWRHIFQPDREAGVGEWRVLGWAGSPELAQRRVATELANPRHAEVVAVPAVAEEVTAKAPRPWHLRTYAALTVAEAFVVLTPDAEGHVLRQLGKRCRTFRTAAEAVAAGEQLFTAGKVDAYRVSDGGRDVHAAVTRGVASDYREGSFGPARVEYRGSIDQRAGFAAPGCWGKPANA